MPELTKDQAWKLSANAEYQKVVAVIMNLATGVLFLPILFLKDFVKLPEGEPPWRIIWPWALLSWIALVLSLMWGMWFYRSSAKFVKVVYGGLEFLELKDGAKFSDLSRLFVYYNERVIEGTVDHDSGAFIRDEIKSLAKQGVCTEPEWPYKISRFTKKPSQGCYRTAKKHRILSYHRISTVDEMRSCLADGFPFVLGFTVYDAFESAAVARSGVLNMPGPKEKMAGGHAVMAVGYDDGASAEFVTSSKATTVGDIARITSIARISGVTRIFTRAANLFATMFDQTKLFRANVEPPSFFDA